jgi:hypothetical protein
LLSAKVFLFLGTYLHCVEGVGVELGVCACTRVCVCVGGLDLSP